MHKTILGATKIWVGQCPRMVRLCYVFRMNENCASIVITQLYSATSSKT